jgi:hypothetical protein
MPSTPSRPGLDVEGKFKRCSFDHRCGQMPSLADFDRTFIADKTGSGAQARPDTALESSHAGGTTGRFEWRN